MPKLKSKPKSVKPKTKKQNFIYAIGRRKTATARIRLYLKKGPILVNDKPISQYFPGKTLEPIYQLPLTLTKTLDKFSATIKVLGSGKQGQLGAVVHGLARALTKHDKEAFHKILKSHGLLTRDPRAKERRKVGTGGKARRKKQSPKR